MMPAPVLMTAEELLANPVPNKRTELVRGRLMVREPVGLRHGDLAARVLVAVSVHLRAEQRARGLSEPRGRVVAAETGFALQRNPDTVRAPDVAYIRADRWPGDDWNGFAEFAPDLAVEVLSRSARPGETLAKIADWLDAGALLVWLIDPVRRLARVYRADGSEAILGVAETLSGEDVIPGLEIRMTDLLD